MDSPYWDKQVAYTILKSIFSPSLPTKTNLETRECMSHMISSNTVHCKRKERVMAFLLCCAQVFMNANNSKINYGAFRSFLFSREVPIRLDYEGKRVDMSHGPLAGLLMGLGQLNCSELRLKRISYRHG
jgi:hypothetical protein